MSFEIADLLWEVWGTFAVVLLGFVVIEACYLLCVCILFWKTPESPYDRSCR